ncbi:MAG: acyl carrier protein [Actinobacteria bacterium]|nr:acyl carrier protein [Actinomycetota bacterium]
MSEHDDFDAAFREVLEEVLGWGVEIGEDDGPSTIDGWDSLAQIRIVHELEGRFGVRLPDDALLEEQSVGSLKTLVLAHAERSQLP